MSAFEPGGAAAVHPVPGSDAGRLVLHQELACERGFAGPHGPHFARHRLGGQILSDLGIQRIRLLSNTPSTFPLWRLGLEIVEQVAIPVEECSRLDKWYGGLFNMFLIGQLSFYIFSLSRGDCFSHSSGATRSMAKLRSWIAMNAHPMLPAAGCMLGLDLMRGRMFASMRHWETYNSNPAAMRLRYSHDELSL